MQDRRHLDDSPPGTVVRAANDGVVAFAGLVAAARYVSIDHPDGVRTYDVDNPGLLVGL